MSRWRLLIHDPRQGAWNMAVDEALMNGVHRGAEDAVLRFYGWDRPTLSLGYLQPYERSVDEAFCLQSGVDRVRRPTGGRAVLHYEEVTYSVSALRNRFPGGGTVEETYRVISTAMCAGLIRAGVAAEISRPARRGKNRRQPDPASRIGPRHPSPCFSSVSRYELTCRGRKVLGSSQRRLDDRFLQHGSLPVMPHWDLLLGATGHADGAPVSKEFAALSEVSHLSYDVLPELVKHLARGFETELGIELVDRPLDSGEREEVQHLCTVKYATEEWTRSR